MGKFLRVLAVIVLGLVVAGVGLQSAPDENPVALTGIVTDSMCGAKHMTSGEDVKCVRACVKKRAQYALLVDQKLYQLQGKSKELDDLAGQRVTVTGTLKAEVLQLASVKRDDSTAATGGQSPQDATPPAVTITIEGLVRDIACPIENKAATATVFNLKCAQECARLGSPLIILTNKGVLYTPISASMPDEDQRKRLLPFLGKYVRVNGQVFERTGTHAIVIKQIHELPNVHLVTDAE
jgi:hypothetical protein